MSREGGIARPLALSANACSPPFTLRTHTHLLDYTHRMNKREWQAVRADQLHRYYRPIQPPRVPVLIPGSRRFLRVY